MKQHTIPASWLSSAYLTLSLTFHTLRIITQSNKIQNQKILEFSKQVSATQNDRKVSKQMKSGVIRESTNASFWANNSLTMAGSAIRLWICGAAHNHQNFTLPAIVCNNRADTFNTENQPSIFGRRKRIVRSLKKISFLLNNLERYEDTHTTI